MGYLNPLPDSNFYQSKPSSPNTPRDEGAQHFTLDDGMTQSNPTYPNQFATELPYSVDIEAEEPATHFSLEKLDALVELSAALESQKVLTMEIALEADLVLGGTELGQLYFSGEAKQKKYAVAMEAISGQMALGIAAIVGAVLAAIAAAIAYFTGKNDQAIPAVDNSAIVKHKQEMVKLAQMEAAQVPAETIAQINEALCGADEYLAKRKAQREGHSIAQELHSDTPDHTAFAKKLNAFEMDHLATGEYGSLIAGLLKVIDHIHPIGVLQDARLAYREMVAASKGDRQDSEGSSNSLKERYYQLLAKPREAHRLLMEQIGKLSQKKASLDAGHVELPKDINHALRNFVAAVSEPEIVAYVKEREEIAQELERMRKEAEALKTTTGESKNAGVDQHGREVLKEIHGLLAVMIKADLFIQRYWKSLDACASYLYWVITSVRYQTALDMKQKGAARHDVLANPGIRHLDHMAQALSNFRQRAK